MPRLVLLNNFLLFLACSILLGAGLSLALGRPVAPAAAAPPMLNVVAIVMLMTGLVMLLSEWFTGIRLVPLVVLLALAGWTALPWLPMEQSDRDRIAGALWTLQWAAMMYWYSRLAAQARADR
ncbi:MAG TPA: hypothetical protein VGO55_18445 [Allosphingosinicella sp.]|jgi:hypothetical protein|nr:hypothetical protein [Allosphingosinicella sp.]